MVNRLLLSTQFLSGIKELRKKHKQIQLDKLQKIVTDLEQQKVVKQYDNHGVGSKVKLKDIHIDGDLILLYRYETDTDGEDLLIISLRLNSIVDHKVLNPEINRLYQVKKVVEPPYKINDSIKEDYNLLYTTYTIEYDEGLLDNLERNEAISKIKELINDDDTTYIYVGKTSRYTHDGHFEDSYDDMVDAYKIDGKWTVYLDELGVFIGGVNFIK